MYYQYEETEINFFIKFCKQQFLKNKQDIDSFARNTQNVLDSIYHSKLFVNTSISLDQYHFFGIIRPYINSNYSYPEDFYAYKLEIKQKLYHYFQIAIQCNNNYVWAWFIIVSIEVSDDLWIDKQIFTEELFKILIPFLVVKKIFQRVIKIFEFPDIKEMNDWKLDKKWIEIENKNKNSWYLNEKIKCPYPKKGASTFYIYLPPKLDTKFRKNSYIYKTETFSIKTIKEKIFKSYKIIKDKYSFLEIIIPNIDILQKTKTFFWHWLCIRLIFINFYNDGNININGFSFFLWFKIKQGRNVYLGDFIKLCNELKI